MLPVQLLQLFTNVTSLTLTTFHQCYQFNSYNSSLLTAEYCIHSLTTATLAPVLAASSHVEDLSRVATPVPPPATQNPELPNR